MTRTRTILLGILALFSLALSGCNREPAVVAVPDNVEQVVDPFLAAMRTGDRAKAESHISSAARDEFAQQYAQDQKKIANAPALTPRFHLPPPDLGRLRSDSRETSVVYAGQKDGEWTSITIRLYRYRDEPYEIEYWRVTNEAPLPVTQSTGQEKAMREVMPAMMWGMGGFALICLIGLAFLIWLVRRRPAMVSPDKPAERRATAFTVRDENHEP